MTSNPHNILGVQLDATPEEIKKAFKRQAQRFHPDKQNGDDSKYTLITAAYEELSGQNKPKVDDVDNRLRNIFHIVINNPEPMVGNIIEAITEMVNEGISKTSKNILKINNRHVRLAQQLNRVVTKEGNNIYEEITQHEIFQCLIRIEEQNIEINLLERVLERLAHYKDVDPITTQHSPLDIYIKESSFK